MTQDLSRLYQPKSVAVIGGGAWCKAVTEQLIKAKFEGDIWPVHPRAEDICGLKAYPTAIDLPGAPDAAFVGINRDATVGAVERLARMGAGGAVCFASGFGETEDGQEANERLLKAAGEMPILGPNCYGFINALDGACLWPDQHGCKPVEAGVAILTQSSNIAINLTMQRRGLPIAYVATCGNQLSLSMAEVGANLLDDPRVSALGVHVEGFVDLPSWQALARKAHSLGKSIVALKVGKSDEARAATVSHTASLAGSDAGANALLNHLGIARVDDLPSFLETLKLLHTAGPLPSGRIASISCSGGEASLIADLASGTGLTFPPLTPTQTERLGAALGPKVTLANPLDYHTYIWRDTEAMTRAFSAMIDPDLAMTLLIVDFPRSDICDPSDWDCVIDAAIGTQRATGGRIAMVASLPELMPEDVAQQLMAAGIVPFNGISEALAAICAAQVLTPDAEDLIVPQATSDAVTLSEAQAKLILSGSGVVAPKSVMGTLKEVVSWAANHTGPFVLKTTGLTHKSETGGVTLNLSTVSDIEIASTKMNADTFLLEEMITDTVAELLIGIVKDPAHGFVITIGAGGIMTELLQDTASVLLPATRERLTEALMQLKIAPMLQGYRNQPLGNIEAVLDTIEALQSYVMANRDRIEELEVNPLIVTQTYAVAADALIRKRHD